MIAVVPANGCLAQLAMRGPVRRSTTVRHAHTLLVGRTPSAKPRGIFACPNGQGLLCGKAICKCAFRSDLGAQRVKQSSQIVQVGTQHRSQAYPLAVRDITAAHRDGVCIATLKRKIRSRRHEPKGRNRQSLALVTARQPQSEPAARNSRSQHRNLEENPSSFANRSRPYLYIQTDGHGPSRLSSLYSGSLIAYWSNRKPLRPLLPSGGFLSALP